MYRYNLLALTLAAGLATVSPAVAQTETPNRPTADSGRRMMRDPITRIVEQREQLALTDDQVSRLEEIRSKYQEKHQGRMEQLRRDRKARSEFRASMDSARAEVTAVLTPEQQKQVDAMREQWRKEWREGHKGRHRHGGEHRRHDHDDEDDSKDG